MNLKEIRELRGLTQREFANKMKTSQPYVANLESKPPRRIPGIPTLRKIATLLNCYAVVEPKAKGVQYIPKERVEITAKQPKTFTDMTSGVTSWLK